MQRTMPHRPVRPMPDRPMPQPVPEPPRVRMPLFSRDAAYQCQQVVFTHSLVPDVSLTSDVCAPDSPVLRHAFGPESRCDTALRGLVINTTSPLTRYNVSPARKSSVRPAGSPARTPLKLIQNPNPLSGSGRMIPVVRHLSQTQSAAEVDRMCKLIEKHDEQLQLISQQIETLLKLQKEVTHKPVTCNAETMTSKIWSPGKRCITPDRHRKGGHTGPGILRKTTITHTHEQTDDSPVECARFAADEQRDENEHSFFQTMLTDIDDILSRSSGSEHSFQHSPAKRHCTAIHKSEAIEQTVGSETIYINRLAQKYLSPPGDRRASGPVHERPSDHVDQRRPVRRKVSHSSPGHDATSIATRNYLQRYGLPSSAQSPPRHVTRPKHKLLDLHRLHNLPKFV